MHELAICQGLMEQVVRVARDNRAIRVRSVTVRIGPLSGVEPALLEGAYPLASAGTSAADSRLILERSPIRLLCLECGARTETSACSLLCACCGHWRVQVLAGDELLLASIELERPQDA